MARKYLEMEGYKVICSNYRFMKGEIDIICENKNEIVFVEVKTRTSDLISPTAAVTRKKQALLIKVANQYIQSNCINKEGRFDIISIVCNKQKEYIEHIPSAFYPL